MNPVLLRLVLAFVLALAGLRPALAERHALVIGNDAYESLPVLQKARNDAQAVAAALEGLGFEVTLLTDAGRRAMTRGISDVAGRLRPGDEVLFYFAGHGVEVGGRNYLLPADAPAAKPGDEAFLTAESVAADDVLYTFKERGAAVTVLILDACRDNPFPREGTRSAGSARGLAPIAAPEGSFILFSAGAGQSALDGLGAGDANPNSVFTRVLLPLMGRADLTLPEMARLARGEVEAQAATVNHKQRPAYYDELTGDYALAALSVTRGAAALDGAEPAAPVVAGNAAACAAAAADWGPVLALADPVALRGFAETHAACAPLSHTALAEAERLEGAAPKATAPTQEPAQTPAEKLSGLTKQLKISPKDYGIETWRVKDGVSDGYVNARSGPGTMHSILFRIPAGTGDLPMETCLPPDPGGGKYDWCLLTFMGQQGWVSKNGIERE